MNFGKLKISTENLKKVERGWGVDLVLKFKKDLTLCFDELGFSGLGDVFKPALKWFLFFGDNFICNPETSYAY
jgi:hypothetical protein